MFDFIAEIGSSFPWIYRGWLYIVLKTYRDDMKYYYKKHNKGSIYLVFDVFMSIAFMMFELYIVIYVLK